MSKDKQKDVVKPNYAEKFAANIIAGLKNGTAPWVRPWKAGEFTPPFNPASGTQYKGANYVELAALGYADPRWMTLKQANDQGVRVKKGEKASQIVFWKFSTKETAVDDAGKPVLDAAGKPVTEEVRLDRPVISVANVFHTTQLDGDLPEWKRQEVAWDSSARAEKILENSGAAIKYDQLERAFYRLKEDAIHMPPRGQFPSAEGFYATAIHELAHWTGQEDRLNRTFGGVFGSEKYAREELRAEIASWMINMDLGLPHNPDQHLSYVQSWIKALEEDPSEIVRACQDAEKIRHYVMGMEVEKSVAKDGQERGEEEALGIPSSEIGLETARARFTTLAEVADRAHDRWVEAGLNVGVAYEDSPTREKIERAWEEYHVAHEAKCAAWKKAMEQDKKIEALTMKNDQRTYLDVPYAEKNKAKELGAKWDGKKKSWYAPEGSNLSTFASWLSDKGKQQTPGTAVSPEVEFGQHLKDMGLELGGELPRMDGQLHRVPLVDRPNGRDGAYRGNIDGRPAGWFQNHVTGETGTWKYSGHKLDQQELGKLREEALAKRAVEEQARHDGYNRVAKRCYAIWKNTPAWATGNEAYLTGKGVPAFGVKVDDQGNLLIPGRDVNGNIRTLQTITTKAKLFERGSQKTGSFHIIDPNKCFGQGPILIAEGYATAASVHLATGQPVVCAFDAGNLLHVAKVLHEKFPEQAMAFMADNDVTNTHNPGINKAILAAEAVGGSVYAPEFSKDEATAKMKDWNDLYQLHGVAALHRQIDFSKPLHQAKAPAIVILQEGEKAALSHAKRKPVEKVQDEGLDI